MVVLQACTNRLPKTQKEKYYVAVMVGQSNMLGQGKYLGQIPL